MTSGTVPTLTLEGRAALALGHPLRWTRLALGNLGDQVRGFVCSLALRLSNALITSGHIINQDKAGQGRC